MTYTCPICGYPNLDSDPRFAYAATLDCPSCGFDFGITDDAHFVSYEQAREEWIADGMPWRRRGRPMPAAWDAAAQLQNAIVTSDPIFFPPSIPQPTDRIGLWIGASPALREQSTTLSSFLDDFVNIVRLYGDVRVETDEPAAQRSARRDSAGGPVAPPVAATPRNPRPPAPPWASSLDSE